jgi:ribonuclease BN (tRNA processing enzyme)
MRLTVIGCSPAWPNAGGANAGYLLEGPGRLLLDCGPGVLSKLRAHDGGWPQADAIVLSHLHLDHWGDVLGWLWGTLGGPGAGKPAPAVWVAQGQRAGCLEIASRLGDFGMLDVLLTVNEYPIEEPFRIAGFELLAIPVPHYTMPTCGLRVSDGRATLAYSADSAPSDALVRVAREADLFLCEATLADGNVEGDVRGHLSAAEAIAAYEASGAARLLLTHRPAELPDPEGFEVAFEGLTIEL